ncbi:MAG: DUF3566 domain-containing protein [Micromonosporaceae bacterium]
MTGPAAVNRPPATPAVATATVVRPSPTPPPTPTTGAAAGTPPLTRPADSRPGETTLRTAAVAPSPVAPVPVGPVPVGPVPVVPVPPSGAGAGLRGASGGYPVITPSPSAPMPGTATPGTMTAPGIVAARAPVAGTGTLTRPAGSLPAVSPSAIGAARVSDAVRSARATVAGAVRGPRRARLHLKRIDPWSVMKFSFAVSLVLFVVAIVATSVLYLALDAMGVFTSLNKALSDMVGEGSNSGALKITAKGVIGTSVLLGAVNMVLFTALMTLGAFVYNVCADLVGGVELTLSEKD